VIGQFNLPFLPTWWWCVGLEHIVYIVLNKLIVVLY